MWLSHILGMWALDAAETWGSFCHVFITWLVVNLCQLSKSNGDLVYSNIKDDNDNNDNDNGNGNGGNVNDNNAHLFAQETDIPKLTLNKEQLNIFDDEAQALYTGLKHNPIKYTCRIVHIVHSLDQRKQAFKNVINTGNNSG